MAQLLDGTVAQSSHVRNNADYSHERINFPVLGIIISLIPPDDKNRNSSAVVKHDGRGSRWEAEVLVINDGTDSYWTIPNAVILPSGVTGINDFHEELPRPCSQMIDGSKFSLNMSNVNPNLLDGDRCIVAFLGGSIAQPIITNWFPHPENYKDTATLGLVEGLLTQGRRLFKRYAGAEIVISPTGSVYLDTNNSGSTLAGSSSGTVRNKSDQGGDVAVSVKPGKQVSINFNPTVPDIANPFLPQPNPPTGSFVRDTTNTQFLLDKDFINAVAGKVVQLMGKQVQDSVLLGQSPTDHAVLGEKFQQTFNNLVEKVNNFETIYESHKHIDGSGLLTSSPTGTPIPNPAFPGVPPMPPGPTNPQFFPSDAGSVPRADDMPDADLSEVVKLQ